MPSDAPAGLRCIAIVPALNEEGNIGRVLDELRAYDPSLEVVVVSDGSVDGTAEVAAEKLAHSAPLTAAVLGIHAERLAVRAAELHMRARFDRVHTDLPVIEVAALPSDAHDIPALREIGRRLTAC